jgi:phosphonate degradation associated HDIG domain protein
VNVIHAERLKQLRHELSEIYDVRAHGRYGLSQVNQLMHAVQSGALAKRAGHATPLVVAALLHDIGHMIHLLGDHPAAKGVDDLHENIAADWLGRYFGPAVVEPVRLHVAAKRYLCGTDPTYATLLSQDSIESLALQGGPMSATEVAAFEQKAYWRDAVALRRLDDRAKDPNGELPPFASFTNDIEIALRQDAR